MSNELPKKLNSAKHLFFLMYQYINCATEEQILLAAPRLGHEYEKFVQWLRSRGLDIPDEK